MMGIDLFTLIAEIFNFLVLVFLLQRFLYRPIIRVMDAREQATVSRLRLAEAKYEEASEEKRVYEEKVQSFEDERLALIEEARQQSKTYRQQLMNEINTEVEALRNQWQEIVALERETFLQDLRQQVGTEIIKTARAILQNMANQALEDQVVAVFVERINAIHEDEKQKLIKAVSANQDVLHVQSAFELSDDARMRLEDTLRPFHPQSQLHFEVDNSLLCGIRIATPEYEISWSFHHYIDTFQQHFQQTLEDNLKETAHERGESQYLA